MSLCLHRALEALCRVRMQWDSGRELLFLGLSDASAQITVVSAARREKTDHALWFGV